MLYLALLIRARALCTLAYYYNNYHCETMLPYGLRHFPNMNPTTDLGTVSQTVDQRQRYTVQQLLFSTRSGLKIINFDIMYNLDKFVKCKFTLHIKLIKIEWQLSRKSFADGIYTWVIKLLYIVSRCEVGERSCGQQNCLHDVPAKVLLISLIIGYTFITLVNEFRHFLSQFSTNFHEILHTLFFIHVVTPLKVSRSF